MTRVLLAIIVASAGACTLTEGGVGSNDWPATPDDGGVVGDGGGPQGGAGDAAPPDVTPPPRPDGCAEPPVATDCADGFCRVPAGCYLMGSPPDEECRDADEAWHWTALTHPFDLGRTEVTQGDFAALMGYNPTRFPACGDDCPVDGVTWHEAAAYANARSAAAGLEACYACTGDGARVSCAAAPGREGPAIYECAGYRLPTEAEFELAYRAGTTTAFYDGPISSCYDAPDPNVEAIGWDRYGSTAGGGPHPVALKAPNGFGLYDMAGNLEEWVHDGYAPYPTSPVVDPAPPPVDEASRSMRGGSWRVYPKDLRAADRNAATGTEAADYRGFRLARSR
jgi:formylglycine-generating enzyme required for sulfatase activity